MRKVKVPRLGAQRTAVRMTPRQTKPHRESTFDSSLDRTDLAITHIMAEAYGVQSPPKFNFWILLVFLAFDVLVLQFVLTSAIQHSSFQLLYSNCRFDIVCFTIQHCSLKYSTFKFTPFNIQVYAIQHSTFEDACFRYPTAGQSMTVSVGSEKYQNSS